MHVQHSTQTGICLQVSMSSDTFSLMLVSLSKFLLTWPPFLSPPFDLTFPLLSLSDIIPWLCLPLTYTTFLAVFSSLTNVTLPLLIHLHFYLLIWPFPPHLRLHGPGSTKGNINFISICGFVVHFFLKFPYIYFMIPLNIIILYIP